MKKNQAPIKDRPNCQIEFIRDFYTPAEAERFFQILRTEIAWKHEKIKVFGRGYWQPRLTAFYAENELPYTYSHLKMAPLPFSGTLKIIKAQLETETKLHFTSCLANLYRDGGDSNGWHADDEKELGQNPVIASLSFGETRKFRFRKKDDHKNSFGLLLNGGSLLLMKGETQHHWQHQIPKTRKPVGERINLTFRILKDG